MKTKVSINLLSVMVFFATTSAQALTITNETPRAYDCPACANLSHEALSTHWILKQNANIAKEHTTNTMYARQYTIQTTGAILRTGLALTLETPEAVIRITPAHRASTANVPFFIQSPEGKKILLDNSASFNSINANTDSQILDAQGETITKLKPETGSGQFILSSTSKNLNDAEEYQIQITNQNNNAYLSIETDKLMYLYGDPLTILINSNGKIAGNPITQIDAQIISPTGEAYPLPLTRIDTTIPKELQDATHFGAIKRPLCTKQDMNPRDKLQQNCRLKEAGSTYQATATLLNDANSFGENWSVLAEATALDKQGNVIHSKIRTSFSYAIPSAVVTNITQDLNDPMTYHLTLNNATASRYAMNAILFAWDQNNREIPLEIVQSADWFAPGENQITLKFSPAWQSQYNKLGIGLMEVIDYGQMRKVFEYKKRS